MIGLAMRTGRRRRFDPRTLFADGGDGILIDPADMSTMFQDAGGSIPAAIDAPVGRVLDKSGRGNHAVQAVPASRPTLRRQADGRLFIEFDGNDGFLHHGFTVASGDVTLSCAAARTPGTGTRGLFFATPPGARLQAGIWAPAVDTQWGTFAAGGFRSSGHDAGAGAVMTTTGKAAPDVHRLQTNGGVPVEYAGSFTGEGEDRRTIGREFSNYDAPPRFAGRLYALAGFARALEPSEVSALVRYQARAAGVVL